MNKIEINGKQFPCRITMGAMLRFKHETGYDVSKMDPNDVSALSILLWCCVTSACKADGVDFDMGLMDFADRLGPDTITEFSASMQDGEKKTGREKNPSQKKS